MQQEKFNRRVRQVLRPVQFLLGRRLFARCFGKMPVLGRVDVRLPERQVVMYAGKNDEISTQLYFYGYEGYECETLELFRRLCQRAEVILDIGANVGIFSLVAAAANPQARIFGFEPVHRVYKIYQNNLRRNHFTNAEAVYGALTDYDGKIAMYIPSGETPTFARTTRLNKGCNVVKVRVPALAGDTFMRQRNLPRLDLIKIDTETTEPVVFQGFRETIARDKPDIICEVLYGKTEEALMEFFGPLGYRYYHVTDRGLIEKEKIEGDKTFTFRNYLFSVRGVEELAK